MAVDRCFLGEAIHDGAIDGLERVELLVQLVERAGDREVMGGGVSCGSKPHGDATFKKFSGFSSD